MNTELTTLVLAGIAAVGAVFTIREYFPRPIICPVTTLSYSPKTTMFELSIDLWNRGLAPGVRTKLILHIAPDGNWKDYLTTAVPDMGYRCTKSYNPRRQERYLIYENIPKRPDADLVHIGDHHPRYFTAWILKKYVGDLQDTRFDWTITTTDRITYRRRTFVVKRAYFRLAKKKAKAGGRVPITDFRWYNDYGRVKQKIGLNWLSPLTWWQLADHILHRV